MNKQINLKQKFIELFTDENIRKLPEGLEWCSECEGVGWHNKTKGYISLCTKCNGKGYVESHVCKDCGGKVKYYQRQCDKCHHKHWYEKQRKLEQERYNNAKKIKYKDYDCDKFWIENWNYVKSRDEFEDWLSDELYDNSEYPTWIFGTKKEQCLSVDICDVVSQACEDGYEDMYDNLDTDSLQPIQDQIDKWIADQGDCGCVYYEDYSVVVELDELIEEIKREVNRQMTVGNLIERLKEFDKTLDVCAVNNNDNPINDYYGVDDVYQITGSINETTNGCFVVFS